MRLALLLILISYSKIVYCTCIGLGCNCTISTTHLNFGSYQSSSTLDGMTNLSVTCGASIVGATISYQIALSPGSSGNFSKRTLKSSSGENLEYNLYTNASRTTILGDGSGGTSVISDGYLLQLLFSRTINYSIYGRIPSAQKSKPGTYNDTLIATVTF